MVGSDEIQERQNSPNMLHFQYAARWHYNRAEIQNNIVWLFCIIAWLSAFFQNISMWFIAVAFIMDVSGAIMNWRMSTHVSLAADFRKFFDTYVFKLRVEQMNPIEKQTFIERSIDIVNKNPQIAKIQMSNTGHDNPPGVRNWYEFTVPLSNSDAIFECQKINSWWNKKITYHRLKKSILGVLLFVPIIITILVLVNTSIVMIIFSSAGLVLKCVERLVQNIRYYLLSSKIDGAIEVLSKKRNLDNIMELQSFIDKRRAMPVLENNVSHKKHAKEYSVLYRETMQNDSKL